MIKIFLSVRNRLGITQKCLESIFRHTNSPYHIYVYDNQTNYMVKDHFKYFSKLYQKGVITQVTFTTNTSTFNAFSKASTCNFFGAQHNMDPKKDSYEFLLMLDNDIILTPNWDIYLNRAWNYIKKNKLKQIKVLGQLPGGIKHKGKHIKIADDLMVREGFLGGSGLWSTRTNFFDDVGFLNLRELVGARKQHDQKYWGRMHKASGGKPYIMGLNKKLGIHCGRLAGSVCNTLTREMNKTRAMEKIKFEKSDEKIRSMEFEEFFKRIYEDKKLIGDW